MKKVLRWIGVSILAGGLLLFLLILLFLDSIVKHTIISGVDQASKGFYEIEIKELDAKFWTGAIRMGEVWLNPDNSFKHKKNIRDINNSLHNVRFHLDTVTISRVDWFKYLLNKEKLIVGDVWITNPDLYIKGTLNNKSGINQVNKNFLEFLPGIIAAFTGSLRIQSISIKQGAIDLQLYTSYGVTYHQTSGIDMRLDTIRIDTVSVNKTLFSESVFFNLRNYKLTSSDSLYLVTIKQIQGNVKDSLLYIEEFKLKKKDTTNRKYKDEFYVEFLSAENKGVNFGKLLRQKKIGLRKLKIKSPKVEFISSGSSEGQNNINEKDSLLSFVNEIAPYISKSFNIDTFRVDQGSVVYKIKNDKDIISHSANNISLYFTKVKLDSSIKEQKLFVEDIHLALSNYRFLKNQSVDFRLSNLEASVLDSLFQLKGTDFNSIMNDTMRIKTNLIYGKGINYLKILEEKKITFREFSIEKPEVQVYSGKFKTNSRRAKPEEIFFKEVISPFSNFKLYAGKLTIIDGRFISDIKTDKFHFAQQVGKMDLLLEGVAIDSISLAESDTYDRFRLNMNDCIIKIKNSNFKIAAGNIAIDSKDAQLAVKNITINQLQSFGTSQRTYLKNTINSALAKNVDYHRLFKDQKVYVGDLAINEMNLILVYDRTKKSSADKGYSPQDIINKIPFYLRVDSIGVINSRIEYREKDPGYDHLGKLSFDSINIKAVNFTNDSLRVSSLKPVRLSGSAFVNNCGLLKLKMDLPTVTQKFDARISGTIDTLSGNIFNDFFAFYDFQVLKGKIKGGEFDMDFNNSSMNGKLKLLYDDLKINMLRKREDRKSEIKSEIGNLIIRNSNPSKEDKEPKTVPLKGNKPGNDNFLDFIWTKISDGIIATVTRDIFSNFVK